MVRIHIEDGVDYDESFLRRIKDAPHPNSLQSGEHNTAPFITIPLRCLNWKPDQIREVMHAVFVKLNDVRYPPIIFNFRYDEQLGNPCPNDMTKVMKVFAELCEKHDGNMPRVHMRLTAPNSVLIKLLPGIPKRIGYLAIQPIAFGHTKTDKELVPIMAKCALQRKTFIIDGLGFSKNTLDLFFLSLAGMDWKDAQLEDFRILQYVQRYSIYVDPKHVDPTGLERIHKDPVLNTEALGVSSPFVRCIMKGAKKLKKLEFRLSHNMKVTDPDVVSPKLLEMLRAARDSGRGAANVDILVPGDDMRHDNGIFIGYLVALRTILQTKKRQGVSGVPPPTITVHEMIEFLELYLDAIALMDRCIASGVPDYQFDMHVRDDRHLRAWYRAIREANGVVRVQPFTYVIARYTNIDELMIETDVMRIYTFGRRDPRDPDKMREIGIQEVKKPEYYNEVELHVGKEGLGKSITQMRNATMVEVIVYDMEELSRWDVNAVRTAFRVGLNIYGGWRGMVCRFVGWAQGHTKTKEIIEMFCKEYVEYKKMLGDQETMELCGLFRINVQFDASAEVLLKVVPHIPRGFLDHVTLRIAGLGTFDGFQFAEMVASVAPYVRRFRLTASHLPVETMRQIMSMIPTATGDWKLEDLSLGPSVSGMKLSVEQSFRELVNGRTSIRYLEVNMDNNPPLHAIRLSTGDMAEMIGYLRGLQGADHTPLRWLVSESYHGQDSLQGRLYGLSESLGPYVEVAYVISLLEWYQTYDMRLTGREHARRRGYEDHTGDASLLYKEELLARDKAYDIEKRHLCQLLKDIGGGVSILRIRNMLGDVLDDDIDRGVISEWKEKRKDVEMIVIGTWQDDSKEDVAPQLQLGEDGMPPLEALEL